MPQPDGSNACCDCPDRVSPCDDCAVTCPECSDDFTEVTVDISGLTLNYEACITPGWLGGFSEIMHEGSPNINQSGYDASNDCDPGDNPPGGLAWFDNGAAFHGQVNHDIYFNADCSDFPTISNLEGWRFIIGCIGGVWYALVGTTNFDGSGGSLYFYSSGSSATLSNNYNSFTATDAITLDDPFINWLTGTTGSLWTGVGAGGTVTIHPI